MFSFSLFMSSVDILELLQMYLYHHRKTCDSQVLTREQGKKIHLNFETMLSFCLEGILWISSIYGKIIILWEWNLYFIIYLTKTDLFLKHQSRGYTDTVKLLKDVVGGIQMIHNSEWGPQMTEHWRHFSRHDQVCHILRCKWYSIGWKPLE